MARTLESTFSTTSPAGNVGRVKVRVGDPITRRFEVLVQGRCVGFGFATAEDAAARGEDFILRGGLEGREYA